MGERGTGSIIKTANPWPFLPLNPQTAELVDREKERKGGRERERRRQNEREKEREVNSWCQFKEVKKGLICVFAYIIPKANSDKSLGGGGRYSHLLM